MSLVAGTRIGIYQVVAPIGAGGMGEVYKARDTRLGRDVAIKVLPDAFARDPAGLTALVMELVEGETLAQRMRRSRVPLPEALGFARQIADGIEAAHSRGIIHRDLKPANVKITPGGVVKVLDFGLAKAVVRDSPGGDETPTVTTIDGATRDHAVIGSAGYMSPEQSRGQPVDTRTDVWGFGCVLFEMVSGGRAFEGDTFAAIMERDPDWRRLPDDTPDAVRRLLTRCLAKDPGKRLRDIADARLEIDEAEATPIRPAARASSFARRLSWAFMTLAALAAAALAGWILRPVDRPSEARLEVSTPPSADPSLAVSPDGRTSCSAAGAGVRLCYGGARSIPYGSRNSPARTVRWRRSGHRTDARSASLRTAS